MQATIASHHNDANNQGDQVGRSFAGWASVFLGQLFLKMTKVAQFVGLLFHGKIYVLRLTKWVVPHFGRFF
jgi:hypothetical protein